MHDDGQGWALRARIPAAVLFPCAAVLIAKAAGLCYADKAWQCAGWNRVALARVQRAPAPRAAASRGVPHRARVGGVPVPSSETAKMQFQMERYCKGQLQRTDAAIVAYSFPSCKADELSSGDGRTRLPSLRSTDPSKQNLSAWLFLLT